jgi:dTDP-glucose 4,6-dehydratase
LDVHFAIGNFIRDAMNGGPIIIKGDGTPYRSYLYAADLAIWLWTILIHGESLLPYNVGSEESISIAETARNVARSFTPVIETTIIGTKSSNQVEERYVPSTQRARSKLELQQSINLENGIQRTLQFVKYQLPRG